MSHVDSWTFPEVVAEMDGPELVRGTTPIGSVTAQRKKIQDVGGHGLRRKIANIRSAHAAPRAERQSA
jgi:hypothetical protein